MTNLLAPRLGCVFVAAGVLVGCASVELSESGRLSSYAGLKPSDGILTKTKMRVDKDAVLAAKSVRLIPASIGPLAARSGLSAVQLELVSNAVNRALCRDLSRRFVIVAADQPAERRADLTVSVVITNIAKTDTTAAGLSVATGIGGKVVSAATGVPVPMPRIPMGLGSLTVEAEAKDAKDRQLAAFVWARGADAISTEARVAEEADAHTLATAFAADFAKLLIFGTDPIADRTPLMPTTETVGEYLGADPKYAACLQFGRHPGLSDTIGSKLGLPPAWTDKGAVSGTRQ